MSSTKRCKRCQDYLHTLCNGVFGLEWCECGCWVEWPPDTPPRRHSRALSVLRDTKETRTD